MSHPEPNEASSHQLFWPAPRDGPKTRKWRWHGPTTPSADGAPRTHARAEQALAKLDADGAAGANVFEHGFDVQTGAGAFESGFGAQAGSTCSLDALRAEMQAGFEALLAELQRQGDALRHARGASSRPSAAGAECVAPDLQQWLSPPSKLLETKLEVTQSRCSCSPGSRPSAAANGEKDLARAATATGPHYVSGSEEWKQALELQTSASAVDDGTCTHQQWLRHQVRQFLRQHDFKFDCFFFLVLVASSVAIGVEIQNGLDGVDDSTALRVLEHIFLALFVIEFAVRVLGDGTHGVPYLWSAWFFFDAALVTMGMVGAWIVQPILLSTDGSGQAGENLRRLVIIRVLRLLRLARALRLMELFEEVGKLCHGLITSFKTVVSACVMIIMTIYVFACLGVEWIATSEDLQADPVTKEIVQSRFSSLPRTMLTLVAFTNADSIAGIYEPMIENHPMLAPFFGCLWLFVTVSLMNLVTAVVVDTAISQSAADSETRRTEVRKKAMKLMPHVQELFDSLDASGEGSLEWREVRLDGIALPDELKVVISEEKMMDLFDFLDMDGSGSVDKDEFVDGVMHLAMQDVPVETTQALQLMRSNKKILEDVKADVRNLQMSVDRLISINL